MDKVLYYHAYLVGEYKSIIQDQLTKIFLSGLYESVDRIELRCADPTNLNYNWVYNIVNKYPKINIEKLEINRENVPSNFRESKLTLRQLSEDAKTNSGIYGYIHTKSVTNCGDLMSNWRLSMDYSIIINWKQCFDELKNGFSAVGPNLRYDTHVGYFPHFSGTYWWTTSEYILTLNESYLYDTEKLRENNHLLEEFWIGSSETSNLKSIFECGHREPYLIDTTIDKYITI